MIEYSDIDAFNKYAEVLDNHIKHNTYKRFMKDNEYMDIYIMNPINFNDRKHFSTIPYYDEIDVNKISATNTSDARKIIPSNFERVIDSIPYILKNECRPISVLKDGENYYIQNGKHRFYAHLLLRKDKIPVSVQKSIIEESNINENNSMINYEQEFYDDDSFKIAYPEKVLEFFYENKEIFTRIIKVKMKFLKEKQIHELKMIKINGDIISIKGCLTSGNSLRSSKVTCKLLLECGFCVDERYIQNNKEFILNNKDDANNINFKRKTDFNIINSQITPNIKCREEYMDLDQQYVQKMNKLHEYISSSNEFNVPSTHFTQYNSSIIKVGKEIFYLIGSDTDDKENYIFIFEDNCENENNLDIEYIGRISPQGEGSNVYNLLSK